MRTGISKLISRCAQHRGFIRLNKTLIEASSINILTRGWIRSAMLSAIFHRIQLDRIIKQRFVFNWLSICQAIQERRDRRHLNSLKMRHECDNECDNRSIKIVCKKMTSCSFSKLKNPSNPTYLFITAVLSSLPSCGRTWYLWGGQPLLWDLEVSLGWRRGSCFCTWTGQFARNCGGCLADGWICLSARKWRKNLVFNTMFIFLFILAVKRIAEVRKW